jgi:hypothetical protein
MMDSDWTKVGALAAIVGGAITLHGITSRKWQTWHTAATGIGLLAAIITWARVALRRPPAGE